MLLADDPVLREARGDHLAQARLDRPVDGGHGAAVGAVKPVPVVGLGLVAGVTTGIVDGDRLLPAVGWGLVGWTTGFGLGYVQSEDYGSVVALRLVRSRGTYARRAGLDSIDGDFFGR